MPTFKIDPPCTLDRIVSNTVHPEYAKIAGLELLVKFGGTKKKNVRVAVTLGDVESTRGLWFSLRANANEVFSARHSGRHNSLHMERIVELMPETDYVFEVYWARASAGGSGAISAQAGQIHMSAIIVDDVREAATT